MTMASDLMGLGVSPLQAMKTATGGVGPLTILAAGTNFATGTKIGCSQYLVSCTNADGTRALSLPTIGGDNGAFFADDFIINNATTGALNVYASTGVLISAQGTNSSKQILSSHVTITLYPISTTQWIGVAGT